MRGRSCPGLWRAGPERTIREVPDASPVFGAGDLPQRARGTRFPAGSGGQIPEVTEMDPKDPSTLFAEGPVSEEPVAAEQSEEPAPSPLRGSGGTGPGPDDLDQLL